MGTEPTSPEALLAHADFVRGLARSLVYEPGDADDLAQQAWLSAIERPPRHAGNVRGWFATILRQFARDRRRADARRLAREVAAVRPEGTVPADEVASREEIRRQVVDAVQALDEPYRGAVLLRFYEDLPPRDIAARQGVPVETVKTRIKRGLTQLRQRLDARHGGRRAAWAGVLLAVAGPSPAAVAATAAGAEGSLASAWLMGAKLKLGVAVVAVAVASLGVWRLAVAPARTERSASGASLVEAPPSEARASAIAVRPGAASDPASAVTLAEQSPNAPARPAPGELWLRVRSGRTGRPLAGAIARLHGDAAPTRQADTGPAGQVRFTGVEPGDYRVEVTRLGCEPAGFTEARVPAEAGVDLGDVRLTPLRLVQGEVHDANGIAVAGAELIVVDAVRIRSGETRLPDLPRAILGAPTSRGSVRADQNGAFALWGDDFPPGDYQLQASAPGHAKGFVEVRASVDEIASASITLHAPAAVTGRVADGTGAGVAGCRVVALPPPPGPQALPGVDWAVRRHVTETDAAGEFRFAHLRVGDYELVAGGGPLSIATASASAPASGIALVVERAAIVTGTVRDAETGQPVASAEVSVTGPGGPADVVGAAQTDAAGAFRVDGLRPGEVTLAVQREGYAPQQFAVSGASGETVRRDIALERADAVGEELAGRVVNAADGTPLAGARVLVLRVLVDRIEWTGLQSAPTGLDGRFTVAASAGAAPRAGERLRFLLIPHLPGYHERAPITVSGVPGALPSDVEIRVDPAARIAGRVLDPAGRPVVGATARAVSPPATGDRRAQAAARIRAFVAPPTPARSDDDGRFVLGDVRPDTDVIVVGRATGFASGRSAPLRLRPGEVRDDVALALRAGGRVRVDVVGADEQPAADVPVRLERTDQDRDDDLDASLPFGAAAAFSTVRRTDANGGVEFIALEPGTYVATATLGARRSAEHAPLVVADGAALELTLHLRD